MPVVVGSEFVVHLFTPDGTNRNPIESLQFSVH